MTIYINKSQTNIALFTLSESITEYPTYLLLQIESKATNISKYLTLNEDVSVNEERYNKYLIQEVNSDNEDLNDQKVNLAVGNYNFYVWQNTSDSLILGAGSLLLESGQMRVIDEQSALVPPLNPNTKYTFK